MAKKAKVTICFSTDDQDWLIECTVYPGSAGSRWEPADAPDVEFGDVTVDGTEAECATHSFEDWADEHGITDEDMDRMNELAVIAFEEEDPRSDEA